MDSNSNSTSKIGVLLVGHGSRLPYGEEVINGLAEIYREQADYPVCVGFMNMNKPSIPSAINELSREGVEKNYCHSSLFSPRSTHRSRRPWPWP